ncbi:HEPN/Toprim-associated domain-containing protein [Sphingomonas rubra]|uniref:HEPN/Toprim N-terminal domain-containing protein n=1 Tax=Sphingomonas rubra TaxID=634430 RepID=A0A1I5UN61_9SPHN|nr:HEPN/Toprim-associated domain-containing protein [Sphingomonas rubra]SFP96660.1 hypothetical protein SAMN04488241_11317 [Sphingomonas rubra]
MGTSIELTVCGVSLSYAKNHMGLDFGYLFQDADLTRRPCRGIDYEYYREHPETMADLIESELTFVRALCRVIPRLNVLGHSLEGARAEYEAVIAEAASLDDPEPDTDQERYLSFEEFCHLANLLPLTELSDRFVDLPSDEREIEAQGRFAAHAGLFARLPLTDNSDLYWSEASYVSARLCILSASSMLLIFALNPENARAEVMWQFGDIVNAGWVARDAFVAGARRNQAILVATEGASDARILRRALDLLRPDVADFFRFIDGEERHHFWGTGNLVKFAEGLLRIDIHNQVLFVLDNDAEGVDAHRRLGELNLTGNLRAMMLPAIEELRSFPALGPEGLAEVDINGRAAAIECYLDLNLPGYPPARVIWTNYKRELGIWQGVLEHKESYDRHFMSQHVAIITSGAYDASKLTQVLDALILEACRLGSRSD